MDKKKNETKKQVNKKSKVNWIWIVGLIIIVILATVMMMVLNTTKKITCSKKIDENGILMKSQVTFNKSKNKIKYVNVDKSIAINDDGNNVNYLEAIKSSLESNYKKQGVKNSIEKKDGKLIINLKYDKEKEYILDGLYIGIEDSGVSVNIVSEDRENNYATIDLSKEYNDKNLMKIMEKADYICK